MRRVVLRDEGDDAPPRRPRDLYLAVDDVVAVRQDWNGDLLVSPPLVRGFTEELLLLEVPLQMSREPATSRCSTCTPSMIPSECQPSPARQTVVASSTATLRRPGRTCLCIRNSIRLPQA